MKRLALSLLCLITPHIYNGVIDVQQPIPTLLGNTFLSTRSQSIDSARFLTGWHRYIDKIDEPGYYGAFNTSIGFTKSTNSYRIAQYFFGTDTLHISGSQAPIRGPSDILADYFGLAPTYESTVLLHPTVRNVMVDFNYYGGYRNFYLRVHAPFVDVSSHFEMAEIIPELVSTTTNAPFPPLYMDTGAVVAPAESFIQAIGEGVTYGQVNEKIRFGRMGCPSSLKTFSNIHLIAGWNFILEETRMIGVNAHILLPNGSRPTSRYLFEPIAGNGKHTELGAGMIGRFLLWDNYADKSILFFVDALFTTLLPSSQHRSFDLTTNGFGSRYTLLKEFSGKNYNGTTVPTINRTTLPCRVHIDFQTDIVFMASFQSCRAVVDLGYEIWARSRERITTSCPPIEDNAFGMKGIQNVATPTGLSNATQQFATLHGNKYSDQASVTDPGSPVFVRPSQIDVASAENPRALVQKIFFYFGWAPDDAASCSRYTGFAGIGGEFEFEGVYPHNSLPNKNFVTQSGLWIKGGITY